MEIEVIDKRDNALLQRTEVHFKVLHKAEATPSRDHLRTELAKHLKASKEVVVVDHAASTFGRFETIGYAKVYRSKDEALSIERAHILVRNQLKEPEVKEGKAAEKAPKPEKPPRGEKPAKPEPPKAETKATEPAPKETKAPEKKAEKKEAKPAGEKKEEKPAKAEPTKKKEK
jgi:small subunit ribosomal protein S24e